MLIQTDSLTKHYGPLVALDQCSLEISEGEIFGLLGPNGAGKSTLIRLLMGFLRPTSGAATIDGLDCFSSTMEVHRRVSYLPGDARLFRRMRGRDAIRFFCNLRRQPDSTAGFQIADRLELQVDRRVAFMSTGMRQKLALAVTLSSDAQVFILDEPTSNLDPNVRSEVLAIVREARDDGRTVVFSSHVLSEIEEICDRVAILRSGEVVHTQGIAELRERHTVQAKIDTESLPYPQSMKEYIDRFSVNDHRLKMSCRGDLAPVIQWMAAQPLHQIRIEPSGLRDVYNQYHGQTDR